MHARSPRAPSAAELVRTFYEDVLGGRRVWPARRTDTASGLWFRVGSTFLEARAADGEVLPPIVLEVDAPEAVAERCWDAGFTVRVNQDSTGRAPVSVFDPFGRRVDLAPRESTLNVYRSA